MSDSDDETGFEGLIGLAEEEEEFDWEPEEAEAEEETVTVLRFSVGDRLFAVLGDTVREITSDLEVTPVPGAPKHVRGVGVIRRRVVGVLNLYEWLDPVAERGDVDTHRIIVLETDPFVVGIEATDVTGIDEWPKSSLDRSDIPETIGARTRRYALGVQLEENDAIVLLDAPRLLQDAAVQ